jgi:uncharacterized protein YyaL (SSP411 family)
LTLLSHLRALTFTFEHDGESIDTVLVYAEPDPATPGTYRAVAADDTGFEGIACLDDTARAALLALRVYERSGSPTALDLARRWLRFVTYMQYPDGSFANFIRNSAGIRNASGPTSHKGGYWWSARALRALATAYRLTGKCAYLAQYRACHLEPLPDGKINGLLALAEMELYRAGSIEGRTAALEYCDRIVEYSHDAPYLLDHPATKFLNLWGYHQFAALGEAGRLFNRPDYLSLCRRTVANLVEPNVQAKMWHTFPAREKNGVTSYDVTPMVEGLAAMYRATGARRYRELALRAAAWFYGRNDARTAMYDPTTGRCRDGISDGVASVNTGAESSIEAGLAELIRRELQPE